MESLVADEITRYFESLKLISHLQHGFRRKRSCLTNLLLARDSWTKALDEGSPLDVIYLDYSKAFDRVNHLALLHKLRAYGHLELGASRRVSQFSHADVSKGRLVYRHGPAEIGLKPAFDFARIWDFSAGTTFSLNFTLIPVNSQSPVVRAEAPIRVKEGDRSLIDQYTLYASDADTAEKDIQLQLIHPSRWGHIGIMDVNTTEKNISHTEAELSQTLTFSMQALKDGRVFYVNSLHGGGQESVEDVFTVRAFDGKFYSPHTVEVKIAIQPTNDENPDVRLLRHFSVTAGSRRILTPYLFSVSDKDVPRDMLQIQFTQLPAYGRLTVFWQHGERYVLSKDSPPITESYLGMMNLLYLQNASTISTHMVATNGSGPLAVDCFMVSVSDGLHVVEKQANILIRPTNRYPPEMTVDASIPNGLTLEGVAWITLDKKPGGLIIADRDTSADDLIVTLVEAPKYGVIQRLPRLDGPDGVDVLDLIEAAWDIEELAVGGDAQELARLSAAGSVGGPKAVKTLHQGDRFTKRQIDTERIHYVYTGTYSEQTVYDSCVVRLSDGEYDTAAVTLRFQIRRTADRAGLQSLRYSPSDPLRSYQLPPHDSNYLRTMIPKMGELNLAIAPYPDDKHPQHQMDQSELVDPIQTAVPLPTWDACVEQHSFLTYQMFLSSLPTWNGTYATDEVRVNANISLFTSSGYNFTVDGRTQPMSCGHFVNARRPQQAINQFSTDELANRLIAFAANGCKDYIDQVLNAVLKIVFDFSQHPIHATLPIRITKKCRQLPRLKQVRHRLEVLPGTDVVVSRKHLEFIDPDSDPTRLIYAIADPFSTGSTHTFGGLQVIGSGATHFFTQYQVNTGQVYFRTNKQLNTQGTAELQVIEIHLFDAGDLGDITNDNDMFQVAKDALSVLQHLGTAETNPYSERMQYVADAGSKVISIRPIMLSISPSPLIQMLNSMNQFVMLTTTPPAPNALETIMPGKVGFRLTAEHLYSSKSDAMYRLVGVSNGKGELFHIKLNRSVTSFVQEDIGRRRMAFLLVSRAGWQDLNTSQKQKRTKTALTEEGLQFEVYDPNEPQEKLRVSMLLQWMEIGISRRVYRVCGTRGLLRVGVERFGYTEVVKNFSADVHVGLTSSTAVDRLDFRLHSPKTVIFQKGETRKAILIRVHLRNDSLGTTHEIIVNLKSPTGAILSSKRQARVIISSELR
ncbi:unnamed protein product [Dicrocoelium dendriticum]|nr:unnamed protein product [Dicrocoelium dendriticum]